MQIIKTKTYKEWRKTNNPYNNFTGGTEASVYQPIHDLIDKKFRNYYICSEDDEDFKEEMEVVLKTIEIPFFKMYQMELKTNYLLLFNKYRGEIGLGKNKNLTTSNNNSKENSTSNNTDEITGNSRDTVATNGSDNGKARSLFSATPNSNVSENTTQDLDTPIKWNFATSLTDNYNKSTSLSESNSTSNTSSSTASYGSNTTNINSNNSSTSNVDNTYIKGIIENNPELYFKAMEMLRNSNSVQWLLNQLKTNFLYIIKGVE